MSTRVALVLGGLLVALGLAACGEQPQVVVFRQGTYQGKPDTPPFAGEPWNGNRMEWEVAMKTRNQNQNEFRRTND